MKKLLLSILTLLYLASTTGAMLETHFCMGKVADWSIGDSKNTRCGLCGMEKGDTQDNGCCSDQESFFKITDDQQAPGGIAAPSFSSEIALPPPVACHAYEPIRSYAKCPRIQAPPGSPGIPRHVLIAVFRI